MVGLLAVATEVARAAGELLLREFGRPARGVASKSTLTDLVSDADREAERLIARLLRERRPDDGLVAEEGASATGTSGLRWLVDPLDGTVNYLYGIPHWAVSIACADERGALVGVVFDPCKDELFAAERGAGARLGDRRLRVSDQDDLAHALIGTGFAYDAALRERQSSTVAAVLPQVRDLRRLGSAALDLAYVASGRLDGFFETGVQPWDVAAGALLVREAGGCLDEVAGIGSDRRYGVIASNGRIHDAFVRVLGGVHEG